MENPVNDSASSRQQFKAVFDRWYQALCAFSCTYVKDPEEAEEIVQEVFVKIWQKRENYDFAGEMKPYLFQAVRNASLNYLKHRKVIRLHASETLKKFEEGQQEDHLVVDELEVRIRTAVASLPTERRKIFLMSRNDGKKYQEIADTLEISVKTVENQMGKALKSLREALVDYLPLLGIGLSLWLTGKDLIGVIQSWIV